MSPRSLFPNATNSNRKDAGSKKGFEGRRYPEYVANRLNSDAAFRRKVCDAISKPDSMFLCAKAGKDLNISKVENVVPGGRKVSPKTSFRIFWKDGSKSNFRTTTSNSYSSQIHLQNADSFISEFSKKFCLSIPTQVQEALRLFSGKHPNQQEILSSIPVDYVGEKVRRKVEVNYFNRLTLASMYGYDEDMPKCFLAWIRENCDKLFLYCFGIGAAKDPGEMVDFMWYRVGDSGTDKFEIYDLKCISKTLSSMINSKDKGTKLVYPNDGAQLGSTIALPFGNLQQHENKLQFRHSREKLKAISSSRKNKFGAIPKISGHRNEVLVAEELNKKKDFCAHFCQRVGRDKSDFMKAVADGKNAKKVSSVIGRKTVEKTDIRVEWKSGGFTNISLKKDAAGQVYLVSARNFVAAYEAQYNASVPKRVYRALELFIGEAVDSRTILEATDLVVDGEKSRAIARRQNFRLVLDVIRAYDSNMASELLCWMKKCIPDICELCFSAGAVKDRKKWANVLWYKNLVDSDRQGLDFLVPIKQIVSILKNNEDKNVVEQGPKNAGSTIQLPFGHLQYHQKQLEFYQQLKKIRDLLRKAQV